MKIPKLSKGGIIAEYYPFSVDFGEKKVKNIIPFYDIHYKIYHRTKNRRIKKKQLKRSRLLQLEHSLKEMAKLPVTFKINDEIIYTSEGKDEKK